jgi:hypothetical protein
MSVPTPQRIVLPREIGVGDASHSSFLGKASIGAMARNEGAVEA